MTESSHDSVVIYSSGPVHCAVCACKGMSREVVEAQTNRINPTGLDHGWRVSDDNFSGGQPNPCQCNDDPDRLHYLMVC